MYDAIVGPFVIKTHESKSQTEGSKGEVIATVPWVSLAEGVKAEDITLAEIQALTEWFNENAPILENVARNFNLGHVIVEAMNRLTGLLCIPSRAASTALMSKADIKAFDADLAQAQEDENLVGFLKENLDRYNLYWHQTNKATYTRQAKAQAGPLATESEVKEKAAELMATDWSTVSDRINAA